jgi:hypothetical protein
MTHVCPGWHALPHVPQFALLVCRSAQTPLQSVVPEAHAQVPPLQTRFPEQIWPQKPQLVLSVCRSTHALPQRARFEEQFGEHVPMLHA